MAASDARGVGLDATPGHGVESQDVAKAKKLAIVVRKTKKIKFCG